MVRLVRSFRDVVRKLAYNTSVDQLKKQGVDKVNVLGMDRIAFLIQEAVKRSLRFKLLALDREDVAMATKDEFMRLLKSNEDLERRQDELRLVKDQAERQLDDLRREMLEQQNLLAKKLDLAERESGAHYDGEDRQIAERLGVVMEGLIQAGDDAEMRDRVLATVMDIVRAERRDAIEAREAARDREVVNLQRRISKLGASLEETEHRLLQVTAMKSIDEGISSVYKEVQGLNQAEKDYEPKRALMSRIFEANMRLQKRTKAIG